MPPFRKDRARFVGIFKATPNISREEYQKRFDAFLDEIIALPIYKSNVLLFELLFTNSDSDVPLQALGYPTHDVGAVTILEFELIRDKDFVRALGAANERGTLVIKDGITFTVDCKTKMYNVAAE
ncbi:hypothetical protein C8J57DRAFT_1224082 [Mycena rebaudengoi]|nr:hypothetical protein C8J57DRAFT_1224082 [Mycena rebaudengoi]